MWITQWEARGGSFGWKRANAARAAEFGIARVIRASDMGREQCARADSGRVGVQRAAGFLRCPVRRDASLCDAARLRTRVGARRYCPRGRAVPESCQTVVVCPAGRGWSPAGAERAVSLFCPFREARRAPLLAGPLGPGGPCSRVAALRSLELSPMTGTPTRSPERDVRSSKTVSSGPRMTAWNGIHGLVEADPSD